MNKELQPDHRLAANDVGVFHLNDEDWVRLSDYEALLDARIQAKQQAVPEGWKLVPVVPTMEMIDAACNSDPERDSMWAAYLSAAPLPPATPADAPVAGDL